MLKLVFLEAASADIGRYSEKIYEYTEHSSSVKSYFDRIKKACDQISAFPYSCPVYRPVHPLDLEFRIKTVGNYNLFYFVDEASDTVAVARVILAKKEERI